MNNNDQCADVAQSKNRRSFILYNGTYSFNNNHHVELYIPAKYTDSLTYHGVSKIFTHMFETCLYVPHIVTKMNESNIFFFFS